MRHIDITIDLETLSLASDAAILQIAAIPWDRYNPDSPFLDVDAFISAVDLRTCLHAGLSIDQNTVEWWQKKDQEVKDLVFGGTGHPLYDVLTGFSAYIKDLMKDYEAESICLWAQGSDFDIAVLRTAFARYNLPFPVSHGCFRDARTFILEMGAYAFTYCPNPVQPPQAKEVYKALPPYKDGVAHTADYDAFRTTCNVWSIFQKLQLLSQKMGGVISFD